MEFYKWFLQESTMQDLYNSTVRAFPKTTKRQHAIDPIKIVSLEWIPYLGVKTLYIKALAQNTENGKEYHPIIVFKNVKYLDSKEVNSVDIFDKNGKTHTIKKIDSSNEVLVRCNCKDFLWRGNYSDHLDKSLYGSKRAPYLSIGNRPSVNPNNDPMLCKHIIKFYKVLNQSGITQ